MDGHARISPSLAFVSPKGIIKKKEKKKKAAHAGHVKSSRAELEVNGLKCLQKWLTEFNPECESTDLSMVHRLMFVCLFAWHLLVLSVGFINAFIHMPMGPCFLHIFT